MHSCLVRVSSKKRFSYCKTFICNFLWAIFTISSPSRTIMPQIWNFQAFSFSKATKQSCTYGVCTCLSIKKESQLGYNSRKTSRQRLVDRFYRWSGSSLRHFQEGLSACKKGNIWVKVFELPPKILEGIPDSQAKNKKVWIASFGKAKEKIMFLKLEL